MRLQSALQIGNIVSSNTLSFASDAVLALYFKDWKTHFKTSRHSSSSVVFIWAKLTVKFMCIVLEQIQDELWSVFYVLQKADSLEKLDIDS